MVVERAKDGKVFQVALDQEMCDSLYSDLKMYFKGNKVKILPTEIQGIELS